MKSVATLSIVFAFVLPLVAEEAKPAAPALPASAHSELLAVFKPALEPTSAMKKADPKDAKGIGLVTEKKNKEIQGALSKISAVIDGMIAAGSKSKATKALGEFDSAFQSYTKARTAGFGKWSPEEREKLDILSTVANQKLAVFDGVLSATTNEQAKAVYTKYAPSLKTRVTKLENDIKSFDEKKNRKRR